MAYNQNSTCIRVRYPSSSSRTRRAAPLPAERAVQQLAAVHDQVPVFLLRGRGRRRARVHQHARLRAVRPLDAAHVRVPLTQVQGPAEQVRPRGVVGAREPGAGEHLLVRARVDALLRYAHYTYLLVFEMGTERWIWGNTGIVHGAFPACDGVYQADINGILFAVYD